MSQYEKLMEALEELEIEVEKLDTKYYSILKDLRKLRSRKEEYQMLTAALVRLRTEFNDILTSSPRVRVYLKQRILKEIQDTGRGEDNL